MEKTENKTSIGGSRNLANEGEKFGKRIAEEGEKLGKRVAERVGDAVGTAGQKLDNAIEYVDSTTQNVRDSFNRIRDEGFEGLRERTLEYTRREPLTALCIAVTAGLLLGWLTKRGR
jgi:ElaB/YqjD/DUF883 family membrane-anchored ribosome-binding protein